MDSEIEIKSEVKKDQKDILLEEIMAKTRRLFPEKKTELILSMED